MTNDENVNGYSVPKVSGNISIYDASKSYQVIEESILSLWKVVNNLTSIQPPRCQRYRVTIFGSARLQPDSPLYNGVKFFASELTTMGCDIITGGGPGLMQAANEGSFLANKNRSTNSIGIRVDLEFEQSANPFVEQMYHHQTFFTRLHHFVLLSNAFVVVPGGIGTTLEALMIWQLLQVRKLNNMPFILVGEMWSELVDWADKYMVDVEDQLASPEDMQIPHCVKNFAEATALLRKHHSQWMQGCEL
ncbi:MAG: LOG family protein [Calothrix sp. C42_A2020_038]|nr:LOG family protein [Calothrix sp. C42_A2020_038]